MKTKRLKYVIGSFVIGVLILTLAFYLMGVITKINSPISDNSVLFGFTYIAFLGVGMVGLLTFGSTFYFLSMSSKELKNYKLL